MLRLRSKNVRDEAKVYLFMDTIYMSSDTAGSNLVGVQHVIRSRRSIRRYTNELIDPAILMRIVDAATWAPSAHNRQPWRFMLVTDPAAKQRISVAMSEKLRADRLADGDDEAAIEQDVRRSRERIGHAPALLFVFLTMACMDTYPDSRRQNAEYLMAVQSTAMATQNALLAAHEEGLGACVMCAPLFCPDTVVAELGVPHDWQPQTLLTIGRPGAEPRNRGRAPLPDVMATPK